MQPRKGNDKSFFNGGAAARASSAAAPWSRLARTVLCGLALLGAGCSHNNYNSGYGVVWVTLTDDPSDFTSYRIAVDSVTLTRTDGAVQTIVATPESVDFTQLGNVAEMWAPASVLVGTWKSASIVLDFSSAVITVPVNGVPTKAKVVGPTGAAVTTVTVNVVFDPANPLVVTSTYATSAAVRLALDLNLAASTKSVDLTTSPPTVTVKPYLTAAVAAPDKKLVRVRGPVINSSAALGTYTVYVRPFHDNVNSLGLLSLFAQPDTVYQINGKTYVGSAGATAISQVSAGTTYTAAFATYEPTATPSATAGIWKPKYVVAGSTLEDFYSQGLEGDVIARSGNTLTLRGATLTLNDSYGTSTYQTTDSIVTVGPNTKVTQDGNGTATNLDYNSIAVGQHIIARGTYTLPNNVVNLDATAGSSTTQGSVRLIPTSVFGSILSSTSGTTTLNLSAINDWPVGVFNFAGSGTTAASNTNPANFVINTGALTVPATTAGAPLWSDGVFSSVGTAPPDFTANVLYSQATVPASLRVRWTGGTKAPFSVVSSSSLTLDLSNASLTSAVMRAGAQNIPLSSLPASPAIVPQGAVQTAGLPASFSPLFAVGDPTVAAPGGISVYSSLATYATALATVFSTTAATQFEARGYYDPTTNTFNASSINVVL